KVAKEGYEIGRVGWNLVGDIQNGEYSLHKDYFGSLSDVHPVVRDYPIGQEILKIHRQINREVDWMNAYLSGHKALLDAELVTVDSFNRNAKRKSELIISSFQKIRSPDGYVMEDGERLAAMDALYSGIDRLFKGVKSYNERIRMMDFHRNRKEIQLQQFNSLQDVR